MSACKAPTATSSRHPPFYEKLIRKIQAPLMIDSTDARALELALTYCQGKSIINSVNLRTARRSSSGSAPWPGVTAAALIVGAIDEDTTQAQAFTRSVSWGGPAVYKLLTGKVRHPGRRHRHRSARVPVATGDANYIGAAVETSRASGW